VKNLFISLLIMTGNKMYINYKLSLEFVLNI